MSLASSLPLRSPLLVIPASLLLINYLFYCISPEVATTSLSLNVANTFMGHFFLWTVVTSSFLETSIIKVVIDLFLLVVIAKQVDEHYQDHLRMAIYTIVTAVGASLATSVTLFVGFVITRMEDMLFSPTMGFGGIIMAYLILLKQKVPSDVVIKALPNCRVQHLPFSWLCLSILGRVIGLRSFTTDMPLVVWSFTISWLYLRFGQHNADGTIGDMQEEFQFVTLYPQILHKYLGPLFNFCYGVSVLCGNCKDRELAMAASLTEDASNPKLPNVHFTKHKVDPVAERRKAKALKMLDAALAKEKGPGDVEEAAAEEGSSRKGGLVVASREDINVDLIAEE